MMSAMMLNLNDAQFWVSEAGQGTPLVLVHGFSLDQRMWDAQLDAFSGRYRVIRYDLRGFGQSDNPSEPYNHADDLYALLQHLHALPAHLVGLSLGGGVVVDFATRYPQATRSVTAVDAMLLGHRWDKPLRDSFKAIWGLGRREGVTAARREWLAHPLFAAARRKEAVWHALQAMVADYSGWEWVNRNPMTPFTETIYERLPKISAPLLAIAGEKDLPDFQQVAAMLAEQVPNAKLTIIPDAGHVPNMERPAAFNTAVLDFLMQVDGNTTD